MRDLFYKPTVCSIFVPKFVCVMTIHVNIQDDAIADHLMMCHCVDETRSKLQQIETPESNINI